MIVLEARRFLAYWSQRGTEFQTLGLNTIFNSNALRDLAEPIFSTGPALNRSGFFLLLGASTFLCPLLGTAFP